jgi:uncharacterized protein
VAYPVTHFEVNARDAKAMQRFYGDLFGWGIDTNNPMDYGIIDTKAKGRGINGGIGATQNGRSWVTFYVETSSIDDTLGKVERLGGKTVMPKMDMGPGEYGLFSDPEGNVIGLYRSKTPPARTPTTRTRTTTRARATAKRATARKRTAKRRGATRGRRKRS